MPDRIPALDVLRGVAILGTLASNVWLFTAVGGPAALLKGGVDATDAVRTALITLSNGKFLALLTLLFGVGLEIQYGSAVRRGVPWPGRYPVRAAILFVEGLLHYLLVFEFDVLMGYAITSLLVAHLIGRSDRVVRAWMWGSGSVFAVVLLGVTALLVTAPPTTASVPVPAGSTASWTAQVAERVTGFALFRAELLLIVPSAAVLFLLGSRLLRAGAFDAGGTRLRRRLAVAGLGVGVPINALTALAGPGWVLVDRYLVPPLVALGLLGAITELVARTRGGVLRCGLAAVGRTALSCYVLQNALAAALCFDWGLGLATRFTDARPWWVVGLWAGISLVLLLAAPAWLRRFPRGPVELLTHHLYRGGSDVRA
ncbi:DUF418 domain-containing protein [Pseudonocardia abyssalis]|uniref:DUF418 domain-containing protein n=1 Tax=Pseudonocardia abyssalis TaxID=2792008 RepID=A0ABS6UZW0_9PSEU|nr:DUF418 domain-containing protein [Pseudonocardia abyssalis]MBW0115318.1 DUF418 domain-containing protein [Pseudonocardia abyssalis]MBW0137796.1 DUF418 domain-containing protein [Pseudonocardia abyssalis]